jgi:hypothetical protein
MDFSPGVRRRADANDTAGFRQWYGMTLGEKLAAAYRCREAHWTEAFAVGDRDWLQTVHAHFGFKRKEILPVPAVGSPNDHMIAEAPVGYYLED